jgi:DNA-binding MarR family transcriptional regulator
MDKPEITTPENALVRDVVELLRDLLHALLAASVPTWIDLQLTLPQLRTLFIIAHHHASSVAQIAKYLGIGEPTASHLIDKLVQAGLADRSEDPADRRRAIIRLSPGGEELIDNLLGWEGSLGGWLDQVPAEDLIPFRRGLGAVIAEVNARTSSAGQAPAGEDREVPAL